MIEQLAGAGVSVDRSCRVLGVSRQNYYKDRRTPTSSTRLRRQWLTGLIREVHVARTFPIEQAADAHEALNEHFLGKLALRPG